MVTGGEQETLPTLVRVQNCTAEFCTVRRNQESSIELEFIPERLCIQVTALVQAYVSGSWYPWSLGSQSNVCANLLEGRCPLQAGRKATYGMRLTIPRIAPVGTRAQVQLRIVDQQRRPVTCVRINVLVAA